MTDFVDDRHQAEDGDLDLDLEELDGFGKLGDPEWGKLDPGRCHVCLAWTRYPYSDRSLVVCPDCSDRSDAEREEIRQRVRDALREVWALGDDELARRRVQ